MVPCFSVLKRNYPLLGSNENKLTGLPAHLSKCVLTDGLECGLNYERPERNKKLRSWEGWGLRRQCRLEHEQENGSTTNEGHTS